MVVLCLYIHLHKVKQDSQIVPFWVITAKRYRVAKRSRSVKFTSKHLTIHQKDGVHEPLQTTQSSHKHYTTSVQVSKKPQLQKHKVLTSKHRLSLRLFSTLPPILQSFFDDQLQFEPLAFDWDSVCYTSDSNASCTNHIPPLDHTNPIYHISSYPLSKIKKM